MHASSRRKESGVEINAKGSFIPIRSLSGVLCLLADSFRASSHSSIKCHHCVKKM